MTGEDSALFLVLVQPLSSDYRVEEAHCFDGHSEARESVGHYFFLHNVLASVQTQSNKAMLALNPDLWLDLDFYHLKEAHAEVRAGLAAQQLCALLLSESASLHMS